MNNQTKTIGLNKAIALISAAILIGYFWGGITVYRELFPFEYVRYIKNKLAGGGLVMDGEIKPRNVMFQMFSPQSDVVMVGDSLTEWGLWNEIFPGKRIANRGIGGDRTDDILRRIDQITSVKPNKAFLSAGTNDLISGKSIDQTFADYIKIVDKLQSNGITVFIQSTVECRKSTCGARLAETRMLNAKLEKFAAENKIQYININDGITSESDGLLPQFTPDGLHLLGTAYLVWKNNIERFVN